MALDVTEGLKGSASNFELRDADRPAISSYADEGGRSNFVAFMLGGVVVAGGLLAFLYYDDANFSRDDMVTGSLGPVQMSAPVSTPNIRIEPRPAEPAR